MTMYDVFISSKFDIKIKHLPLNCILNLLIVYKKAKWYLYTHYYYFFTYFIKY